MTQTDSLQGDIDLTSQCLDLSRFQTTYPDDSHNLLRRQLLSPQLSKPSSQNVFADATPEQDKNLTSYYHFNPDLFHHDLSDNCSVKQYGWGAEYLTNKDIGIGGRDQENSYFNFGTQDAHHTRQANHGFFASYELVNSDFPYRYPIAYPESDFANVRDDYEVYHAQWPRAPEEYMVQHPVKTISQQGNDKITRTQRLKRFGEEEVSCIQNNTKPRRRAVVKAHPAKNKIDLSKQNVIGKTRSIVRRHQSKNKKGLTVNVQLSERSNKSKLWVCFTGTRG